MSPTHIFASSSACHSGVLPLLMPNSVQASLDVEGNYTLTWNTVLPHMPVQITAGVSPDSIASTVLASTNDTVAVISGLSTAQRMYFRVTPCSGIPVTVAPRHLSLTGAANFRDLGGYPTADGRTTKWGVFYRSDALSSLTASDVAFLENSGLKLDVDLRMDSEVTAAPDVTGTWTYKRDAITPTTSVNYTQTYTEANMVQLYESIIDSYASVYADLFRNLAEQGAGSVYHCTLGKDRAGIASALLLMSVNVPDSSIVNDYALTDQYDQSVVTAEDAQLKAYGLDPTKLTVLFTAQPNVMAQTIAYIRQKYGTVDAYLASGGLDAATLATVRKDLLGN